MGIFSRTDKGSLVLACALHDSAANAFAMPMFFASEGLAVRALTDAANGGDKNISAHAQDYKLYKIGHYDPVSGVFTAEGPELIIAAASVVARG